MSMQEVTMRELQQQQNNPRTKRTKGILKTREKMQDKILLSLHETIEILFEISWIWPDRGTFGDIQDRYR